MKYTVDSVDRTSVDARIMALREKYGFTAYVGGTSSFDMAPAPHDKVYALAEYCKEHGLAHDEVLYVGDDYGPGGNDESVFRSDFCTLKIDDYTTPEERLKEISIL